MRKTDLLTDYLGWLLLKLIGPLFRAMPVAAALFLGRRIGDLLYYFSCRKKAVVYANLKTAFGRTHSPGQLSRLCHRFYQSFGQSVIELFLIPRLNQRYFDRYIQIEGSEYIRQALSQGKGVILLGVHAGSWEFSNLICSHLGVKFNLFVGDQRHPRLNRLLNHYRRNRGCVIIERKNQTRALIEALRRNEAVGITLDQGGREGMAVPFFGKDASMATGGLRLALRYGVPIIPGYHRRIRGSNIKIIIGPPFELQRSGNEQEDIRLNLQRMVPWFEAMIAADPADYLWTYKVWKYSSSRQLLILSDGKAGHLRQSQAVAKTLEGSLSQRGLTAHTHTVEINFRVPFWKTLLAIHGWGAGRYRCQGCLGCAQRALPPAVWERLMRQKYDFIISTGSSLAGLNFLLSRENLAKSIVVMKPPAMGSGKFDLVVMPKHDRPAPAKNVVVTQGALNLIDEQYLQAHSLRLKEQVPKVATTGPAIGLLLGGDSKTFRLPPETVAVLLAQLRCACTQLAADLLVTTSRRSSPAIEQLVREQLGDFPRTRLMVIANDHNIPEAVGGILGLSRLVVVSPESISMISEAASSRRYVLVVEAPGLSRKHRRFLDGLAQAGVITLVSAQQVAETIALLWKSAPPVRSLNDSEVLRKALENIV